MDSFNHDSLYYVFTEVIRLHFHRIQNLLDKVGLYPGQPHMLFALRERDGQSQRELAERLKIKPATITVMLNRMEKVGLVKRRIDSEDQRVSRVYLTEQGREICEEVKGIMRNLEGECFSNFTIEEKALFRRLLLQVKDNLSDTEEDKDKI